MLKFIRCKCKNGLKCGDCRGETCNNSEQAIMDLEDPDEHEDIIMSRKTILNIFFHKYNLIYIPVRGFQRILDMLIYKKLRFF